MNIKIFIMLLLNILFIYNCNIIEPNQRKKSDNNLAFLILSSELLNQNNNLPLDRVTTTQEGAFFRTTVNASSTKFWVFVDFKNGGIQVTENGSWDMKFRRFAIGTNSGASGSGNAGACNSNLTDLSQVNQASCTNFTIDSNQSQIGDQGFGDFSGAANSILFSWYNYNSTVLTSKRLVYVIRGSNGTDLFKIQITDYYSSAGTSGYPSMLWSKIN